MAETTSRVRSTEGMLEIRLHGRGGQGVQVGCQILAAAFFRGGRQVQAFAAYGGERRGAPVTASLRVAAEPIHVRCDIERPDVMLVLDPTLLAGLAEASLGDGVSIVVNAPIAPCHRMRGAGRVTAVDASAIARRHGLGPIVAPAVLGGFGAATDLLALDDLLAAVEEVAPVKKPENVAACAEAWAAVAAEVGP